MALSSKDGTRNFSTGELAKFEKERGHVDCSIDCYMKQYGVSEQETLDALNKQVVDLWKDINGSFSNQL
ncbi:unnamed protein product [Prunus brigantina]